MGRDTSRYWYSLVAIGLASLGHILAGGKMFELRARLMYLILGIFSLWLAFGAFLLLILIDVISLNVKLLDPMLTLVGGLSWGAVTNFFMNIILIAWYFIWRKKGEDVPAGNK